MKDVYLITGATGFIGANITHELVKRGKSVHVLSRKKSVNWRLEDIKNQIHFHTIDLQDQKLTVLLNNIKPRYVFHLAAYGAMPYEDNLNQIISTNILGTSNLIKSLNPRYLKLFINTSTSAEYAIKNGAFKETDTLSPLNDYAISKVAQTLYCQKEAIRNNLPIITFRLFSTYGYFEEKTRFIPHVIINALKNKNIPLSQKHFVRDFIFVEDVIAAYLKACNTTFTPGDIFNIGTGKQYTLEQVVNLILQLSKSHSIPLWKQVEKQERQIEPPVWKANRTKALKTFGWEPSYSLEKGLTETITWFQKNNQLYA
jgi:nucleoside-diphosphate-sugar epimerase